MTLQRKIVARNQQPAGSNGPRTNGKTPTAGKWIVTKCNSWQHVQTHFLGKLGRKRLREWTAPRRGSSGVEHSACLCSTEEGLHYSSVGEPTIWGTPKKKQGKTSINTTIIYSLAGMHSMQSQKLACPPHLSLSTGLGFCFVCWVSQPGWKPRWLVETKIHCNLLRKRHGMTSWVVAV